jgi:hypothetical protein
MACPGGDFVHSIELYCKLPRGRFSDALFSAQAHVSLALAQAAFPWKKAKQGQE